MTVSFRIRASSLLAFQPTPLSVIESFIDWSKNKMNRKLTSTYMEYLEYTTPAKQQKSDFSFKKNTLKWTHLVWKTPRQSFGLR